MSTETPEAFRPWGYRLTRKGSCMVFNGLGASAAATALHAVTGKSKLCDLMARDGDEGRLAE